MNIAFQEKLKTNSFENPLKVVFYANCQNKGIAFFLDLYLKSKNIFANVDISMHNYIMINEKRDLDTKLLSDADLFVYHPVDDKHGIYSTSESISGNITSFLKPDCIKIAYPFIYNSSFWCLLLPNSDNIYGGGSNVEPIKKLKDSGLSLNDVLTRYRQGLIDFEYQRRFERCISILQEKETKCHVVVHDFIQQHAGKIRLFYNEGHPTTPLFVHCVNQIIQLLDPFFSGFPLNYPEQDFVGNDSLIHTTYDYKFWKFTYPIYINDEFYVSQIVNIYNQIQSL